ncbi:hypothetical protein HK099_005357, partial [Clydaea vesicula]
QKQHAQKDNAQTLLNLDRIFTQVQNFYNEKAEKSKYELKLLTNIQNLIIILNGVKLKDDIIKEAKRYYQELGFKSKLNSKAFLVPFLNGVFDLNKKEFRPAIKQDYVNLTFNFDYDPNVFNPKVSTFIEQILSNKKIRDFVLKEFSKCLNGNIPNTKFLIFIGNGANGKSQLLNLMKLTIGEFGEKMESTLLTRKRNNPNETSTEKLKLLNKRFAFLSEPEDGEKFNIGLLKELTGSEEIVARGLYSSPDMKECFIKFYHNEEFYKQSIFRKLKLKTFINTQNQKNTTVIIGDWSKTNMKHQVPTKGKGFREMFKKAGFNVFLCNEFLTSSICPGCKKRSIETFKYRKSPRPWINRFEKVHGLLHCKSEKCQLPDGKNRLWNRDDVATMNIRSVVESYIIDGCRPKHLCK